LKYFCDSCGRLATTRSLLCKPKAIPKAKAAKKKATGKARTKKAAKKTTKKKAAKKKKR
jgi:hypothetical protein